MNLHAIGCDFAGGVFNVVLGRNGAGKTRLARRLAGLDADHDVTLDDRPVTPADAAIVFQEFINYPSLNVHANIASPLVARRTPAREIAARVAEIARALVTAIKEDLTVDWADVAEAGQPMVNLLDHRHAWSEVAGMHRGVHPASIRDGPGTSDPLDQAKSAQRSGPEWAVLGSNQ